MEKDKVHYEEVEKTTISDIADALGVSKTTVSRAISGKGRIGKATKKRVMDYIEAIHYHPNIVAKGLAQSKTYNIGWVIPGDYLMSDLPFFQRCMMGISEVASTMEYDIIVSMVYQNDISQLERIVRNNKVDGIVLGRSLVNDGPAQYLKENSVPFVVVGSSKDEELIQIDNDHVGACKELTAVLLMKGLRNIGIIGGDSNHVVNQTRYRGFVEGMAMQNKKPNADLVYMDADNTTIIERAVDDLLRKSADCIICMDDFICKIVLEKLHKEQISIPEDIRIASFYNSSVLENNQPPISAIKYDPKELGIVAARTLFDYLDGKEIQRKIYLSYEVLLKTSTK